MKLELPDRPGDFVPPALFAGAFLASTAFFLWQHGTGVGWDFAAYSLNARYWFQHGAYFQALRPPLAPLVIGLFSWVSKAQAEVLFISAASLLFAFSSARLARKLDLPPVLFYLASLTPFLLIEGFKNGTELFCLALLELALASLGSAAAPVFFALAVLTRYPAAAFGVLLLFTKDARKILRDAAVAAAVATPWLIYNQIAFGNWAASFMDSYAMNMRFRAYLATPFRPLDVLIVGSYLLPLAALGFALLLRKKESPGSAGPGCRGGQYYARTIKDEHSTWRAKLCPKCKQGPADLQFGRHGAVGPVWIMAAFAALSVLSYARIQQKQTRYLFDLTLPLAYFAVAGLTGIGARKRRAIAAAGLAALSLGGMILVAQGRPNALLLDDVRVYKRVLGELGPRLADCRLASNAWDFLNYLGRPTEPFPMDSVVEDRIAEGYLLLIFKNMSEPKIGRGDLDRWPILAETRAYVLIGKPGGCLPARRYVYRYLELRKERDLKLGRQNFPDTLFKLIFR